MRNLNLILICLFVIPTFVFSQNEPVKVVGNSIIVSKRGTFAEKTVGSPFLSENFMPAEVKGYKGEINLRYNIYTDDMEFEVDDVLYSLKKEIYSEVILGPLKTKYIYATYKDKKNFEKGFLEVIYESDKVSFYKKERVEYRPAQPATTSYDNSKPATYKRLKPIYYVKYGFDIVELPRKAKKAAEIFGGNQKEVAAFIKSKKINLEQDADLIRLAKYIDSL